MSVSELSELNTGAIGPDLIDDGPIGTIHDHSRPENTGTLDEPVSTTILRDLNRVWIKMKHVLLISSSENKKLADWDLWGPLFLCLLLSITLSQGGGHENQAALIFAIVFVLVWCGAGIVTLNAVLLGGTISFLQSICVLGYCLAPLNLASIICRAVNHKVVNAVVCLFAFAWSTRASVGFMAALLPPERKLLGVYPVCLFYLTIGWLVMMQ
ncbi:hypothetical protein AAMO2058_000556500 [Amorphochlora amoebiformis]